MTDEEACAAALDRHFDEADSYTGDEQRAFDGGFAAGLAHARQWRPLTSDPASWPEEGQHTLVVQWREDTMLILYATRLREPAHVAPNTFWHALPPPPKGESK